MIRCQSCGAIHPPNTLFCDECGYRLLKAQKVDTAQLPHEQAEELIPPLRLSLYTLDNVKQFECALTTELFIGRTDYTVNARPDIDLSRLKGLTQGVSRRHARLVRTGQKVLLEDLNSLNGTFVGGMKLVAHRPQDIQSGDEIQFGNVVLRIQFNQDQD